MYKTKRSLIAPFFYALNIHFIALNLIMIMSWSIPHYDNHRVLD